MFENLLLDKLNIFCPEKTLRLSDQDKPWINSEIKQIDKQKCGLREVKLTNMMNWLGNLNRNIK